MPPLVTRIDHLVVPVEDPEGLYALFTDGLGLPALWPVTDVGPFRSAAVGIGNCWIEIVADAEALTPLYAPALPAVFRGIAFDGPASCAEAAAPLAASGVSSGEVRSFSGRRPDGSEGPLVTILPLDGLIGDAGIAYLCQMALPVSIERVAAKTAAAAGKPGAIGIQSVGEVQIGAGDDAAVAARWTRLAGEATGGVWRIGDGPAVQVKSSPIDGIAGITLHVDSLPRAVDALRGCGLLGPLRASGAGVNHAAAFGLDIWLTASD